MARDGLRLGLEIAARSASDGAQMVHGYSHRHSDGARVVSHDRAARRLGLCTSRKEERSGERA
eukprot:2987881-Prymnesium_polylepis.2